MLTIQACSDIAENGIETMNDLEELEESDMDSFSLNVGEYRRVKKLLSALSRKNPGILPLELEHT